MPGHFDIAALAIGIAVSADGLDGRIARMTNTTSDFGREFDSLADVITFGVAPAVLAFVWGFRWLWLADLGASAFPARVVQLGLIASLHFLVAGRKPAGALQYLSTIPSLPIRDVRARNILSACPFRPAQA